MTDSDPHLAKLFEFLRFPSVSTDPARTGDMRECAAWLAAELTAAGLEAEVCQTGGHPAVVARNVHKPDRRTVLIYGHYDVQPVDPVDQWESPPFEPEVRDGRIYARGSTDNKGQILAHILGVAETMREAGDLPVNLTFFVEGEEEIGSPSLPAFLEAQRERLACDVVAISDTGMVAPGVPTLTYALRGIACMELKIKGPATDLHSGIYGGAVANPATVAARLAASLHDESGTVRVEGFYDKVLPLADWEREAWAGLPYGEREIRDVTGVPELAGESGFSGLERCWARPTAEVNGIGGGYSGEGSKTVIPAEAFVKLSFRLVPDQDPDEISALVRAHFERLRPAGVTLDIVTGHQGSPYIVDPTGAFAQAAERALARVFDRPVARIREGGSIPIVQDFKDILGADTLLLGLALPDCRAHAPNENFPVENFGAGRKLNRALLDELAG